MEEIRRLAQVLSLFTDALSCHATVAGMTAENAHRQATGSTMAYADSSFVSEARRLHEISREILSLAQGANDA